MENSAVKTPGKAVGEGAASEAVKGSGLKVMQGG